MIGDYARDRLRRLMKKYKLTSPMVAKMVGVQPQTVRMWMCGVRSVPEYALTIITLTHEQ